MIDENIKDKLVYMINLFDSDVNMSNMDITFINSDNQDVFRLNIKKNYIKFKTGTANYINATFIDISGVDNNELFQNCEIESVPTSNEEDFFKILEDWYERFEAVDLYTDNVSEFLEDDNTDDNLKLLKRYIKETPYGIYYDPTTTFTDTRPTDEVIDYIANSVACNTNMTKGMYRIIMKIGFDPEETYYVDIINLSQYSVHPNNTNYKLYVMGKESRPEKLDVIAFPQSLEKLSAFVANSIRNCYKDSIEKYNNSTVSFSLIALCHEEVQL